MTCNKRPVPENKTSLENCKSIHYKLDNQPTKAASTLSNKSKPYLQFIANGGGCVCVSFHQRVMIMTEKLTQHLSLNAAAAAAAQKELKL